MTRPELKSIGGPALHPRGARTFAFTSGMNGVDYLISVATPPSYALRPDDSYRYLFVLDADMLFAGAYETAALMSRDLTGTRIEEMIIVGVGYADKDGVPVFATQRMRDFSPPGSVLPPFVKAMLGDGIETGGAPAFLRMLEEEVAPWLRESYRCAEGPGALFGFSYGGLFALNCLFSRTALFDRYIIGSPGILAPDDAIFNLEQEAFDAGEALRGGVFFSLCELEETGANPDYAALSLNYRRMVHRLRGRKYPDLAIHQAYFLGESHNSAVQRCLSTGLRALAAL